tara:strand:- start:1494 stop:1718 length:225 start_codon:yes stop_codon:yes gene_type:complete
VGFTKQYLFPNIRCALTAPFHPYLYGGLLSVALSVVIFITPRSYLALYPLEPGLSSDLHQRLLDQLEKDYIIFF